MLIHLSIPARNPQHVASVLAELMAGTYELFGPVRGGFMVFTNNQYAQGIEVYPHDTLIIPGKNAEDPSEFIESPEKVPEYSALHFALAVSLDKPAITAIAEREHWRYLSHRRGNRFNVIELWIENRILIELITADDLTEALSALKTTS